MTLESDAQAAEAAALSKFATIKGYIVKYGPYLAGAIVGFLAGKLI